jgi:hypothetical protein
MLFGPLTEKLTDENIAYHMQGRESISDITQEFLTQPPAGCTLATSEIEISAQIAKHGMSLVFHPALLLVHA